MTITLNTYQAQKTFKYNDNYTEDPIVNNIFRNMILNPVNSGVKDVIVRIIEPSMVCDFGISELTKLALESSIGSFEELWEEEDDDYWASYLD
jgi:predicted transcriptional regulator